MSTSSSRNSSNFRPGIPPSSDATVSRDGSSGMLRLDSSEPPLSRAERNIQLAQETIYRFLLNAVKKWPPEEVLLEFKRLFFYHVDSTNSGAIHAIYEIVFSNDEAEFRNTLKRCCYILVNNWDATRNYKPIQELVQQFELTTPEHNTISPTLKRLRGWVENFRKSKDYEELKLFTSRYEEQQKGGPWTSRYTSYLLVPQFVDLANPAEQREAARALAKHLKDRFKFDLAMYVAKSQIATSTEQLPKNPTMLGDDVLRLIKTIVAKRGRFSYANLANIFVNQVQHLTYQEFKQSLRNYLVFSVENRDLAATLQSRLFEKLDALYQDYDANPLNDALMLRTCNRIIEYLTIENRQEPSQLFVLLLSKGNPMTLVVVLLKVVLICKHCRTHLEAKIADLIRYYENYPEDECNWIVNFLEIFNVTFAIHAENVQYNLIKMDEEQPAVQPTSNLTSNLTFNLDDYRIFSQMKQLTPMELTSSYVSEEPALPEDPAKG